MEDPAALNPGSELAAERRALLEQIEGWLEVPMLVLGFAWLVLLGVELLWERVWNENPLLSPLSTGIWLVFIVDFGVKLLLAPEKLPYLRRNWLTAVSLVVPALRLFRIVRVVRVLRGARAVRGLRLLKIVGSLNRGMRALGASMSRRGFGYVVALTLLTTVAGAAGMYRFESDRSGGFDTYGEALWWTAMIMTTMGSAHWPHSAEGRVLCVLLALYAFAIFGYVTAAIATYFVGRDASANDAEIAGARALAALRADIAALRRDVAELSRRANEGCEPAAPAER